MINKANYKAWIAAIAIIPSIQAAVTFPSFPTIQDQIFNFPKYDLHPPRIPLKYIRGVVSSVDENWDKLPAVSNIWAFSLRYRFPLVRISEALISHSTIDISLVS